MINIRWTTIVNSSFFVLWLECATEYILSFYVIFLLFFIPVLFCA